MKKVHITSLGCAKNLVDSEVMGGQLKQRKYILTQNPEDAELIIVNTCGFIKDAKDESIQAIFEAVKLKETDPKKQVFVTGCLSQRYRKELGDEIPEIDALFGTEDYAQILEKLGEERFHAEDMYRMRQLSTPHHFAYLKISEGCNHSCSFCAIPGIRGKHRSRTAEDILLEARILAEQGVKELILVSQDTSYYGKDLGRQTNIVDLIEKIAGEKLFKWIRPLYWYPTNFPMDFIRLMDKYETVIPYLDMPIQHASDHVLSYMRRAERRDGLLKMYRQIREIRPDIAVRTTLIVGHPGERETDFEQLKEFIQEVQFDRMGAFIYSDEEGTPAFDMHLKVDNKTAEARHAELMALQQEISATKNRKFEDTIQTVLIDGYNEEEKYHHGRTFRDAPEIDNEVIINDLTGKEKRTGTFQQVRITDTSEYELYGTSDVNSTELHGE
ncbi:MAG: 30S ribosomal protein S12 methylthiotransferase RimO [Calditrichales bacterium]|nr:MAG: 30S ribosomal protein S12 methylthiotransferase RimO [Calditrichales bacterium]